MANNKNNNQTNNKTKKQGQVTKKSTKQTTKKTTKKVTKKTSTQPKTIIKEQPKAKKKTEVRNKITLPKSGEIKPPIKPVVKKAKPKIVEEQKVVLTPPMEEIKKIEPPKEEKKIIVPVPKVETKIEPKIETQKVEEQKKEATSNDIVKTQKPKISKYQKMYQNNKKNAKKPTTSKKRKIVDKKDVLYNVALKSEANTPKKDEPKKIKYVNIIEFIKIKLKKKQKKVIDPKLAKQLEKERRTKEYKTSLLLNKKEKEKALEEKEQPKKPLKDYSKSNIFIRTIVTIYRNLHIIFNSVIIITFIILLAGLILPKVYTAKTILFYSGLLLFLILVAITQNKYLSGKIFTIILTAGMIIAISNLQYTYDFVNIMNKSKYTYKTYYVVAIDNAINRSINSINTKKVGVIKEYETKTSRVLNTKLRKVTYIAYEDEDALFNDFYTQKYRAAIVNDNQLKYLENNAQSTKKVKILYEFKAVTKK